MFLSQNCRHQRFALAAIAFSLTGCAASYKPYESSDAAKVRVTQFGYYTSTPSFRQVGADGQCGERFVPPALRITIQLASGHVLPNQGVPAPVEMPRAHMYNSPPPTVSNVAEMRLQAGAYQVTWFGQVQQGNLIRSCTVNGRVEFKPNAQYALTFSRIGDGGACRLQFQELQPKPQQGEPAWTPVSDIAITRDVCPNK
jgi:hypothetical protein